MDRPTLHVTADRAVSPQLLQDFTDYATSHPEDALAALSLPPDARLRIHLHAEPCPTGVSPEAGGFVLDVSRQRAERTLAVLGIREMSHGTNFLPTFHIFGKRGVFDLLDGASGWTGILQIAQAKNPAAPRRNLGYLYIGLRLLALQGWLELDGVDEATRCRLTDTGRVAIAIGRDHAGVFATVFGSIKHHKNYRLHFRDPNCPPGVIDEYARLVDGFKCGWGLPVSSEKTLARVVRHLRKHLDGTVVTSTAAALGMPAFESTDDRLVEVEPGLFEQFDAEGRLDPDALRGTWNRELVGLGIDVLVAHGVAEYGEGNDARLVTLTEAGRVFLDARLPHYSALPISYQGMHERIEDLYFGDPDPLDVARDGHLDRLMNVWGVGGAISTGLADVVCGEFLRAVFDDRPLDQQPAGIADMGCGSGTTVRKMAQYIIERTRRGQHLDSHPLLVVAADASEVSRQLARRELDLFASVPGVRTAVLSGDVTDPGRYDEDIRKLDIRRVVAGVPRIIGAADLMHSMFHLTHERTIGVPDNASAMAILRAQLKRIDRAALARSLVTSLGHEIELPASDDELLSLVAGEFRTSLARRGRMLPALCVAADLVEFLHRWDAYSIYGLVIAEAHSPRPEALREPIPDSPSRWMRLEKIGHLVWSDGNMGDQYALPYVEHELATVIAGFSQVEGKVYAGRAVTLDMFTSCVKPTIERSIGWYKGRSQ